MELRVEKGGLEARLRLAPVKTETGGYVLPSLAEIEVFLKEKGVKAPMDAAAVEACFERLAHGLNAEPIAARGKPPVPGKDGTLEFLIDLETAFVPPSADAGAVDLRASLIHTVSPGQPLAVLHPPTAGLPGLDVFGNLVGSIPGKALQPRLGANTMRSEHDANLIVAKTLGHARLQGGVMEVEEFYQVPGDVDYASGNIAFPKSVQVRGDVKAGFAVEAGGDVEIEGLVEDCSVKAKGKLLVKGGFTGQGKGMVQAGGEISLGYVRNQAVRGEESIRVAKEAVNSRMQSRQSVLVNGLLAGGKVQARHAIECQVAGTETGTPTHLEAGFDYITAEEMADIRAQMEKMGKYARKLEESLRHIHDMERMNRGLDPWAIDMVFQMETMRGKVDTKIKSLRDRYSVLDRLSGTSESATITVHRKTYPGVVMKIGRDILLVDEVLNGPKTFFAKDGAILIR
ncbi:MAG: DUF342 domain-containing protein [Fibrobacteres bacterium]|nr:DUF342 domain-containing protein [Fibrobacterota bacterium]